MRLRHWLPPVVWMGVILWFASDTGSAENTGRFIGPLLRFLFPGASPGQIDAMHGLVRKAGHLTEYAILAALWLRPLARPWRAWSIAVAWALVDEAYQSTTSSRSGSALDVAIDAVGALFVALPARFGWRLTVDALATGASWTAAGGGGALLIVNVMTGVPSGVLWVTVPVAVFLIAWSARRRGRAPRP